MQGWTPDFIAKLTADAVAMKVIDRIITVPGSEAIHYAGELARKEGIFVGITGGATFAGALRVCAEAPTGANILAMLPDTGRAVSEYTVVCQRARRHDSGGIGYLQINAERPVCYVTAPGYSRRFRDVPDESLREKEKMPSQTSLLGAAGEHYVMSELLRRGYIAALAPQGVPKADIIVCDVEGTRLCSIQVKTRRERGRDGGWHMKDKHEKLRSDTLFYCFVDFGTGVNATVVYG